MTLGWIQEDAWDAFYENTEVVPPPQHGSRAWKCPFCDRPFDTNAGLSHHLGSSHRGERPVLLVGRLEPSSDGAIRSAADITEVGTENCTRISIAIDGGEWRDVSDDELRNLLGPLRDATVDVALENAFERRAAPIRSIYRARIRIPEKGQLDAVDLAFRHHLAVDNWALPALRAFVDDPSCGTIMQDYVEALANYIRGTLAKDQPAGSNIRMRQAEYRDLYIRSETGLRYYDRPLGNLIVGLVRFALNDLKPFSPTGFEPLDELADRLRHVIAGELLPSAPTAPMSGSPRTLDVCPVDHGVSRVLELARILDTAKRWGPALSDQCRHAADSTALQREDREKIMVLWASAAIRLRAAEDAKEPLRSLGNSHPFGKWAEKMLTELTS